MNVDQLITDIIKREGAVYTNDPSDKGGPTKFGITQATLAASRGHAVSPDDVKNLTEVEARAIYTKRYVNAAHFNLIADEKVRAELVDFGVNSGPELAVTHLQQVLGVTADGDLGPKTLTAANAMEGRALLNKLAVNRLLFLLSLGLNNATQLKYVRGWANRAVSFIE